MRLASLWLLGGCSSVFGLESPHLRADAGVDGPVDVPTDAAVDGPPGWGNIQLAFASATVDDDPTLTDDMLEMFFNRGDDIYVTTRADLAAAWATPTKVMELSSNDIETTPEVAGGGLVIGFASNRPGGAGGTDLYYSTRTSRAAAWAVPVLFMNVNSASAEYSGSATGTGLTMVMASNRPGGLGATDIYVTTRSSLSANFGTPVRIDELSSASAEFSPFVTLDGNEMYLDSTRNGGQTLYHSVRTSQSWAAPQPITSLDDVGEEADPWVSADGRHMFFASTRSGGMRIYEATR